MPKLTPVKSKKVVVKAPTKHLVVFVATGFEDTELITALDVFKRAGLKFDLISAENKTEVAGYVNGVIVKTTPISNFDAQDYSGVYLPGGEGHVILKQNDTVLATIKNYYEEGKFVSAICAAPEVLKTAGVLGKATYTSHQGFATGKNNTGREVEKSNTIYTGRDFRATLDLADAIVDYYRIKKLV